MTRNEFKCPAFMPIEEMNPVFQHIKRVYELELGKPAKFAHKLNDNNPQLRDIMLACLTQFFMTIQ